MTLTDAEVVSASLENIAVNADLVNMWRSAIMKARMQQEHVRTSTTAQMCALVMNFDGAGQPLTVGMGGLPVMPPGAFTIVGANILSGIWSPTTGRLTPLVVTRAVVDLYLAASGNWAAGATPISSVYLISQAESNFVNVVPTWPITQLQPGDIVSYVLSDFVGSASVVTVTLALRRLDVVGVDAPSVTDSGAAVVTDSSGRPVTTRFG